jgi:hypothetical protein
MEKAVKAGPCFTQHEGKVGHVNKKVGKKRRFRDACDAGSKGTVLGLRGAGGGEDGEELETQRNKEAKHKQGSFQGKGEVEAVEKRKRPLSEEGNEAQEQQHEEGENGSRPSGEAAKKKRAKCAHNRQCRQFEGSSTCECRRILRLCKQCNGLGICEHNRERSKCKQCGGGARICEHNRQIHNCKQ